MAAQVRASADEPGVLSFGAAYPGAELLDTDRVRRAVSRAVQRQRGLLTHYTFSPGQPVLRRAIARYAAGMGCALDVDRIVVTNGCRDAIALALRAVTAPGETVALESPTYFGFLEILQDLRLHALEIPTHPRTGMSLDALQLALQTQPVRAVLAVPTLSNPLGACMSQPERRRLARMMAEFDIPLIEDAIYNDLAELDEVRRAVKAYDRSGHVMICGSFTKTMAPGLRLGWIEAGRWHPRVLRMKLATAGPQTGVLEVGLADLLNQPGLGAAQRRLRRLIAIRVDEARALIARHFPRGTRVTDPPGGYILWVELPTGVAAGALFEACLAENICVAPGQLFSSTSRYLQHVRLGVGGRWDEAHKRALARVGEIATAMARAAQKKASASATTPATAA
jgi:DNA-binding transcriptional MocR family regulator